jgi:hypothetical protein
MILRASISLYLLEALAHLLAVLPCVAAVAYLTGHLPPEMTLLGTQGPPLVIDVALKGGTPVHATAAVSASLFALAGLFLSPLLMSGTMRVMGGEGRVGPLGIVAAGARRYPRFLLLNLAFLISSAACVALLVWTCRPQQGALCSIALVIVLTGVRDLAAAVLRRPDPVRVCLKRIARMAAGRPLPLLAAFVVQSTASWLVGIGALRLQAALHAEAIGMAAVLILATQFLVVTRCAVRCAWFRMLVRMDS